MHSKRKVIFSRILCWALVATFVGHLALAQAVTKREHSFGARRQLATIIFAGLSGAILGLSTLSFYGRPQERLSNIAVGFALGIFAGTIYTTYKAAAKPSDFYGPGAYFDEVLPMSPHNTAWLKKPYFYPLQYQWTF